MSQPDILIDEDGTPHLAGLGNAYILPNFSAWSGEDTDKTYHQAAELARQDFTSMHPTKADDMAAFGFMAFEVQAFPLRCVSLVPSPRTGSHWTPPIPWFHRDCGDVLGAEGGQAVAAKPRSHGSNVGHDRMVLARRALATYVDWGRG